MFGRAAAEEDESVHYSWGFYHVADLKAEKKTIGILHVHCGRENTDDDDDGFHIDINDKSNGNNNSNSINNKK